MVIPARRGIFWQHLESFPETCPYVYVDVYMFQMQETLLLHTTLMHFHFAMKIPLSNVLLNIYRNQLFGQKRNTLKTKALWVSIKRFL